MARILVIDDDPFVRQYVADVLTFEGHDVTTADDGFSGLRAVEAGDQDVVLLDVMMPGMSGHDVLKRIRSGSRNPLIPVVMLTAYDDDKNAWQAWTEGVDYFLGKPFEPETLLGYLRSLLAA